MSRPTNIAAVARILIVGGGCRGRRLAAEMTSEGRHAVRITTRGEAGRAAIEATGAECWIGTPNRLGTLRAALESVTVVCWLLGSATGGQAQLGELHASRLEAFLGQAIDTTMRGFVYEASGTTVPREVLTGGERIVRAMGERNAIPVAFLRVCPDDLAAWLADARAVIQGALS
jgi:hypothetical protein